jgi:hypothetical protein
VYANRTAEILRQTLAEQVLADDVVVMGGETVLARQREVPFSIVRYWGHWSEVEMRDAIDSEFPDDWQRAWVVRFPSHDPEAALAALAEVAVAGEAIRLADGVVEVTPFTRK